MATQVLVYDTIVGECLLTAPDGWLFDKGMTIVWARLIEWTRRGYEPFKTQRDRHVWEGQVYLLALILSKMGMAPPYWECAAFEIVLAERANAGRS